MVERRGRCFNRFLPGSFLDKGLKYKMSGLTPRRPKLSVSMADKQLSKDVLYHQSGPSFDR